jgi:hypothetical protein
MSSSTVVSSLSAASGLRSVPLGATDAPVRAQNGVRVAIAGCGYWGSKHARAARGGRGSGISLIDADQDLCAQLKQTFPAVLLMGRTFALDVGASCSTGNHLSLLGPLTGLGQQWAAL